MGVRRRAVRERLARDARRVKGLAEFDASLSRIKRVVDEAIAEGLKTLTPEQFSQRLAAVDAAAEPDTMREEYDFSGSGERGKFYKP